MDILPILTAQETLFPLGLTARVAGLTLILHLVVGLGLGYLLSRKPFPGQTLLDFLVTLPLVFPPIATGFLLLFALGKHAPLGRLFTALTGKTIIFDFWGLVLAAFIAGLPLAVKPIQSAIQGSGSQLMEAAYVLGRSEWNAFLYVVLPNIKKVVAAGVFLAFARSLGEVGVTLMLGGNIEGKTNTLSLAIYNAVFNGEFEKALVLSAFLALVSLTLFFILKRLSAV
ncbi:MAG TPA: molybdate ABC transporter permease subunit [Desulfomicrobiaceae bacterium]|nr:molybdate ABC transporter permease subunit [Desulfomicrobiaceae bacterium]